MKKLLFLLHITLFLLYGNPILFAGTPHNMSFQHINGEDGLSQSNVKAILQDSYGFMWFGTKNGLNRFDGQRMMQFNCFDAACQHGNQNISALFEDRDHILWVGTDEGVFCYDPKKDAFTFIDTKTPQGERIYTWISTMFQDPEGDIWICAPSQGVFRYKPGQPLQRIGGYDGHTAPHYTCITPRGEIYAVSWYADGLYRFDPSRKCFTLIRKDATGEPLAGLEINTLCPQGDALIMSRQNGNLMKFNTRTQRLEEIPGAPDLTHTLTRFAIVYGNDILAGTYDGLYITNVEEGRTERFAHSPADPASLSDNIVYSAYRDHEGGLWIGTMYGGVDYLPQNDFTFRKYLSGRAENTLSSPRVRELAEDQNGNLWIGTEDAGINILSTATHAISRLTLPPTDGNADITVAISSFDGKTYCNFHKKGMAITDGKGRMEYHSYEEMNIGKSGCSVYSLHMDSQGTLWAGSDQGIFCAPKGSLHFAPVPELQGMWVFDILQEKDGTFWFATMGKGVYKYHPKTKALKHYTIDSAPEGHAISSNAVSSLMQDSKGNIWLSTDRGGLCRYNHKTDDFTRFSIEEGLPDNTVYKVLEDEEGYLWFGTNRGLVRFKPGTRDIRVFTTNDGLCSNQFNYKSAVKGRDGNFYFGTIGGLVAFNPRIKEQTATLPPIYITRLSIFNEEVTPHSAESPLDKSIFCTDKIVLPYDRANISLDIALLSYSTTQTNAYAYKLDPIDEEWIRVSRGNSISYANLPPGKYTLHLRAATHGGNTDPARYATRSLDITVLPPWWGSSWAYAGYAILVAGIFAVWFYWYRRHKNHQLAERQKLFEIEKEKELNQNKVEFFTEIAHEIRTPLTLINGPLEIIQEMDIRDEKLNKNLDVIATNTRRLLNLASQLLDFQKMGANKLTLNYETVNVSELLQETVDRFEPTFTHQHKELKVEQLEKGILANIDKEAITKILSNLFNNALKYGREHIAVSLTRHDGNFSVSVYSDGEKIPADKAEQIFEPFYQNEEVKNKRGVGIGLALARSLALLHKGSLMLDTQSPGNTFVLTVPLNMDEAAMDESQALSEADLPLNEGIATDECPKGNVILIVEDEESIRNFMKERLSELFIVETAPNGKTALEILRKEHVDLIVSDVMMPGMNGFDLCKAIKRDINLSHIPIIFLTAKNDTDSKINGLKAGAEAYIEKPFSYNYLKAQILSLLGNRRKERESFAKRPFFPMENMQMSKEDEEFMNKVMEVINANIEDETFNVERMATELAMSRSSLLRKIKTLFNMSPIDFIRIIRLKKAAEMIQEGKYRVGEICYMVGFNSHSYFSKLFCKQFGMTPKDFEKQVSETRNKVRQSQDIDLEDLMQGKRKKT